MVTASHTLFLPKRCSKIPQRLQTGLSRYSICLPNFMRWQDASRIRREGTFSCPCRVRSQVVRFWRQLELTPERQSLLPRKLQNLSLPTLVRQKQCPNRVPTKRERRPCVVLTYPVARVLGAASVRRSLFLLDPHDYKRQSQTHCRVCAITGPAVRTLPRGDGRRSAVDRAGTYTAGRVCLSRRFARELDSETEATRLSHGCHPTGWHHASCFWMSPGGALGIGLSDRTTART